MKISFDINGVLDTYPEMFPFAQLLRTFGHEVGIVTGNASWAIPPEWNEQWDFIITCDSPEEEMRLSGHLATTDMEKMKYWKSAVLKEQNVDLHFDDYADVMKGNVVRIGPPKNE